MDNIPQKFVVSRLPKQYLKQGLTHCGAFSIKGILSAFGKDDKEDPRDYYPSRLRRALLLMSPSLWARVLTTQGVSAQVGNMKNLSDEQRIMLLKSLLLKDTPIMLRIGNGYLPNGGYSALLASIVGHWITLWGYDDAEKVFYVYDSAVPLGFYDKDILAGNKKRTYIEMMRDINSFGFLYRHQYVYIVPSS